MKTVAKTNYLQRSKDSGMYYFRRAIPQDCQEALKQKYPSGVIKKSLRTKDHKAAKEECRLLATEFDQEFANIRAQDRQKTDSASSTSSKRPFTKLDNLEILRIANNWIGRELQEINKEADGYILKGLGFRDLNLIKDSLADEHLYWCYNDEESALYQKRKEIEEIAAILLDSEGVEIDEKTPRLIDFHNLVTRGKKRLTAEKYYRLVKPWENGNDPAFTTSITHTLAPSNYAANPPASPDVAVTFEELAEAYIKDRCKNNPKTEFEYRRQSEFLFEYFGKNTRAAAVSRQRFRKMMADLEVYPSRANTKREYKGKTIDERIAIRSKLNGEMLAVKTITNRMEFYSSLYKFAEDEFQILYNPAKNLRPSREDEPTEEETRQPFTIEQLNRVFAQGNYIPACKRATTPEDFYWAPLVGLYTGMRRSEVCQLHCDDIREEEGIPYFQVRPANKKEDPDDLRKLKSKAAARIIPIHGELEKLGFLEFVARRKKSGQVRLFHEIKYGEFKNRYRHFGDWFIRYLEKIEVKHKESNVVFHSFRHSFRDAMLNNGVDYEMRKALGGWSSDSEDDSRSTEQDYGRGFNLLNRNIAIQKIEYPGLDLSHLYKR